MNVALVLFAMLLAVIFNACDGAAKGVRAKGVEHKTKLHRKIFHHPHHYHHHHYHPHHPHHHHHYHGHHRHHLHYHHHHPHHHHDNRPKHHYHYHRHYHHHHNPLHHHFHQHNHFHKNPVHHYHHKHSFQPHHGSDKHHQSHRRSDIFHVAGVLPTKLKLHVQVKDMQATKRQSLPNLLANLGQHLMNLGSSLSPRKSQMETPSPLNETHDDKVGNEISETTSTEGNNFIEDSSSTPAAAPEGSRKSVLSVTNAEALLHKALDAASSDHNKESGFSGNGEANTSDATSTKDLNSDEGKKADRRNETYSEHEMYGPMEKQEHEVSNDTIEDSAEQRLHEIDDMNNKYQLKDRQASTKREDKPLVQGTNPKNAASKKDILTDDENTISLRKKEKTFENGIDNASLRLDSASLPEEPKSLDRNSTMDENDRHIVEVAPESYATLTESNQSATTPESDSRDIKEEKEENIETSGSGDDSLDDVRNNEDASEDDYKEFEEESGSGEEPTEVKIVDVSERKTSVKDTTMHSDFSGSNEGVKEPSDQPAVVNVAGNQTMGNQSEEAFYSDSTESIEPKNESHTSQSLSGNDSEKAIFSVSSAVKDATIYDSNPRENLDSGEAPPNKQSQPASYGIDNGSRAASFTQGSLEQTEQTQAINSQNDQNGISDEPKTPAVIDGPAEPPLTNIAYPTVVNVDGSQLSDYHEDASQDISLEDNSDEIPVYTLSSPVGDDSLAEDETTLSSMPASSVNTASADISDSGATMSPGYSESSLSSEGYSTFPTATAPSEFANSTLAEEGGFQRDMLDDPVQESLETVVDSKSS